MSDTDREHDDVAAAFAILREAAFPVERIRIMPATPSHASEATDEPEQGADRNALLDACLAILDGGDPWSARDLAREIETINGRKISRKDVNSVLNREGRDRVIYDREAFTYRLAR